MTEEITPPESLPINNPDGLRPSIIKSDSDGDMTTIPLFIGPTGDAHTTIFKTAVAYTMWRQAIKDEAEGKQTKEGREAKALELNFKSLSEEHFADIDNKELIPLLLNYMQFIYNYADRLYFRDGNTEILELGNLVNTAIGEMNSRIPFIMPIKPNKDTELSLRDQMRRTLRAATGSPDVFRILLKNSLLNLSVKIPTPTDLVRLMNQIATTLHNYGSTYNINSILLERSGVSEILIGFILDRLKSHNVKDVIDHYELKRYILSNDINTIAMALLCITAPKGVSFRTYCVANKCKLSEIKVVDPTTMVLSVDEMMPEDRRQIFHEVVNKGRRLSREELSKYKPVYLGPDNLPLENFVSIMNEDKKVIGKLWIDVPSVESNFDTFASIRDRINPELRELAMAFPSMDVFKTKRQEYLASIRGYDILQWFSKLEWLPAEGVEGKSEIVERSTDPREFEMGLMDIFGDDEELYMDALQKVISLAPRMTYTFIGISNDQCPSCKNSSEELDVSLLKGFTPIDPILTFFARTQMMIGMKAEDAYLVEESLS